MTKSRISLIFVLALTGAFGATPARPPIVAVSGIAVKVSDLAKAREFYSGVVGLAEAFPTKNPMGGSDMVTFKINDKQYIEVAPDLRPGEEDRLLYISLETTDARRLREYLASKSVSVPAKLSQDPEGNLSFVVTDPDGNSVRFIQYLPNSVHLRNKGKLLASSRIADHALHVGVHVKSEAAANAFYKDILGFRLQWKGGPTDDRMEWISMLVPEGNTWVEYMVNPGKPSFKQLGSMNHICLGTLDINELRKTVVDRGYKIGEPTVARDGRYLLHLFDQDSTRTEIMVRKPVEKPCCTPMNDVP
jgi:catechol 2,3-dioxygenase-like lactoylglutathione lyase family enzyme